MTYNARLLDRINNKHLGKKVYFPNGQNTIITCLGSFTLPIRGTLKNVLVVLDFKHNLLSVSQMTRELRCSVHFFPEFCIFQDLFSGEVEEIGKEVEGLYHLPNILQYTKKAVDHNAILMAKMTDSKCMPWHKRMGHSSFKVLKQLPLVNKEEAVVCDTCPVCPIAKQTRLPFPVSLKLLFFLILCTLMFRVLIK